MKKIRIRAKLTSEMLATSPARKDIYGKFIATKCPLSPEQLEEELQALPDVDQEMENHGMTVYPRYDEETGVPMIWDFQIRGFIKEALKAIIGLKDGCLPTVEKQKALKLTDYQCKRTVDNCIFVSPRKIPLELPEGGEMGCCQRSLRAITQKGERVALAYSETVPESTEFEFVVELTDPRHEEALLQCMLYGQKKGFLQWRSGGKGTFEFTVIEEEEDNDWLNVKKHVKRVKRTKQPSKELEAVEA